MTSTRETLAVLEKTRNTLKEEGRWVQHSWTPNLDEEECGWRFCLGGAILYHSTTPEKYQKALNGEKSVNDVIKHHPVAHSAFSEIAAVVLEKEGYKNRDDDDVVGAVVTYNDDARLQREDVLRTLTTSIRRLRSRLG